ncbi:hypothetical protein QAD02_012862 [Eretmocerus hayati]|uniref:Uncharacterized protein n=1 Tax=Eretmocerus hayati TaxID=131215 RepID=A0ACC2P0X3_9HYME|nr:hypothetical protein QAD02_012862 [Eretmocerus hayati]
MLLVTRTADCVVVVIDVVILVVTAKVTTVVNVVRIGATEKGGNSEVARHGRVDVESATPLCDLVDGEVVVDREAVVDETNSVAFRTSYGGTLLSPLRLLGIPTVHGKLS